MTFSFLNDIKLLAEDDMTMSQSINICFSRCSGDVLSFCSLAIKLFRGSLTVSETFFFNIPSFPFLLGGMLGGYINLPLSVYPAVACQSK